MTTREMWDTQKLHNTQSQSLTNTHEICMSQRLAHEE